MEIPQEEGQEQWAKAADLHQSGFSTIQKGDFINGIAQLKCAYLLHPLPQYAQVWLACFWVIVSRVLNRASSMLAKQS